MAIQTPYTRPETYFFLVALALVGILAFLVFLPFLSTLVLAATVAVVLYPAHKKVVAFLRGKRTLAALFTVAILLIVVISPLLLITAQVFNEATAAYHHLVEGNNTVSFTLEALEMNINSKIETFSPGLNVDVASYITSASEWGLKNIGNFFSGTLSVGLRLFLGLFALFYFLRDGRQFVESFQSIRVLPREHADLLIKKLRTSIRSIIGGTIVVAIAQGLVSGLAYLVFGLPNPALWGTITGLAALVPGLGTSLVLVPAVIYLFVTAPLLHGIGLAITGILIIGLIDNLLTPKLISKGLNVHPIIILFSIIGGLAFFGPEGFLLGPLVFSLLLALLEIYRLMVKADEQHIKEEA